MMNISIVVVIIFFLYNHQDYEYGHFLKAIFGCSLISQVVNAYHMFIGEAKYMRKFKHLITDSVNPFVIILTVQIAKSLIAYLN